MVLGPSSAMWDGLGAMLERSGHHKITQDRPRWPQDRPKTTQEHPKIAQEPPRPPKMAPRALQDHPSSSQDCPKKLHEASRRPQERPRDVQNGSKGRSENRSEIESDPGGPKSLWSYACRRFRAALKALGGKPDLAVNGKRMH